LNQVTSQRRWFGKALCAIGKTDKGHWCLSPLFTTTATRYIYIYSTQFDRICPSHFAYRPGWRRNNMILLLLLLEWKLLGDLEIF
jgi:hypothetical protein